MINNLLCKASINIATSIFTKSQILFAFIAGSRAKGSFSPNSDIDLFIVIDEPNYEKEKKLAEALKSLHMHYNLHFDHCGEIFSWQTFENLLNNTHYIDTLVGRGFCKTACFKSECILSIARKTLVILSMLANKKSHFIGDKTLYAKYEKIAIDFFSKNSRLPLFSSNVKIEWTKKNKQIDRIMDKHRYFSEKIAINDFFDTPIGIGLETFFLKEFILHNETSEPDNLHNLNLPANICPIGNLDFSIMNSLIISQCIGFH